MFTNWSLLLFSTANIKKEDHKLVFHSCSEFTYQLKKTLISISRLTCLCIIQPSGKYN